MSSELIDQLSRELQATKTALHNTQTDLASVQERYANLYNLAPVGHLTIDSSGSIRQCNDMALETLGARRDEVVGQKIVQFVAASDREAYEQFQGELFAQDIVQVGELRLVKSDGSHIYAELRGRRTAPKRTDEMLGFVVIANVTERRETHDALRRRNHELDAVNRFARAVSDSLDLAEVVNGLESMLAQSSDVSAGAIFIYDASQNALQLERHWGPLSFIERLSTVPMRDGQLEQIMIAHRPYCTENIQDVAWLVEQVGVPALPENRTLVIMPMVARGQIEGAIWLFCQTPGPVGEDRIAYFNTLGQQAGIAMRGARLFGEVCRGQERLRLLTRTIVSAQEEERRRVSRELHDEAGQLLTALKLSLEMLREDLLAARDDTTVFEAGQQQLASAISLSERTMAHIRGLVHNLRPTALDDLGLNSALDGLCHDFAQRRVMSVRFHQEVDDALLLPDSVQIVAYRFLQEALTNVSKHARASEVQVVLREVAGDVCLSIEDNGVGFEIDPATEGIGLLGMRERLESIGGKLEIFSEPSNGTRLVAWIPMDS